MKRFPAPKSLKIGGQQFRVEPAESLVNDKGERLNGDCDEDGLVIRYERGLKRDKRKEILIHEPIHVLMSDLGLDEPTEERVVTVLAKSLLQIIRDNPELVSFLTT